MLSIVRHKLAAASFLASWILAVIPTFDVAFAAGLPTPKPSPSCFGNLCTQCIPCNYRSQQAGTDTKTAQASAMAYGSGGQIAGTVTCTAMISADFSGSEDAKTCALAGDVTPNCTGSVTCSSRFDGSVTVGAAYAYWNMSANASISIGGSLGVDLTATLGPVPGKPIGNGQQCTAVIAGLHDDCVAAFGNLLQNKANSLKPLVVSKLGQIMIKTVTSGGGGGGGYSGYTPCLAGDTSITMADGSTVTLDQLRPGQWLGSIDKNGQLSRTKVVALHKSTVASYQLVKTSGADVKATKEHMFMRNNELVRLQDLKPGDSLLVANGAGFKPVEILAIEPVIDSLDVYSVETSEGPNTLIANGIAAHAGVPQKDDQLSGN